MRVHPYACTSQKVPPLSAQMRMERSGICAGAEDMVAISYRTARRLAGPICGLKLDYLKG